MDGITQWLWPAAITIIGKATDALTGAPARDGDRVALDWSWAFVLAPVGPRSSRLLVQVRADYRPAVLGLAIPFCSSLCTC
ncbi:MAG: hypothetical protein JWO98_1174 [Frankiales bacterium]|nr:hypothetical protein [Frankiales bacterium]